MKRNDLTGKRFGMLTVVELAECNGMSKWLCHCDCGNDKVILGGNLTSGKSKSCGCTVKAHGDSTSKLYAVHKQMRDRGICDEWFNYLDFRDWAISNGYSEGARFQRIDRNAPFGPDNCEIKGKSPIDE